MRTHWETGPTGVNIVMSRCIGIGDSGYHPIYIAHSRRTHLVLRHVYSRVQIANARDHFSDLIYEGCRGHPSIRCRNDSNDTITDRDALLRDTQCTRGLFTA